HDEPLLPTARQHAMQLRVVAGVDFLMRHVRRHVNEVALTGFGNEFEAIAPAQPRDSPDHVDDTFQITMMVSAGFGLGIDGDSTGPKLGCSSALGRYGSTPVHPQSLGRPVIQFVAANYPHAVRSPPIRGFIHASSRAP